jgi:hypothetical protein
MQRRWFKCPVSITGHLKIHRWTVTAFYRGVGSVAERVAVKVSESAVPTSSDEIEESGGLAQPERSRAIRWTK